MRQFRLLQVGQTTISEEYTPYSAGIYFKTMSVSLPDRALSPIETIFGATWDPDLPSDPVLITGVSFEKIPMSEVNSIAELRLQDFSFYFDNTNQLLYLALLNYTNFIINDEVNLGETLGFVDKAGLVAINGVNYPLDTYIGSVQYDARLNDVSITNGINDQKNGLFIFEDLEVAISNPDGLFDEIRDSVTGNKAELLIANLSDSPEEEIETGFLFKLSPDPDDFTTYRSGVVEDVDYSDPDNPSIRAIDVRANWTQTINTTFLTVAEFAGLPDKFVNSRKTLLIGAVDGAKCIPLRADGAAAAFDYFITDVTPGDIQSISSVYFKGEISGTKEDRFLTGGEYSVNLTTGIITVNNVNKGDVWVYGVFTTMSETVEIILYLLETYEGLAYISSNFNIDEIEVIRALDYSTHVYIDEKGDELFKVIEKLCSDIQTDMIQIEDVLTMIQANTIGLVSEEIPTYQIIENPPQWDTSRTDTIKTITVNYNQDYRTKLTDIYYDNSLEATATDNNRKAIDQSFDVNLTVPADVIEIFTLFYNRFVLVPRVVSFSRTIPFMANVADFISFPVVRKSLQSSKEAYTEEIIKAIDTGEIKTIDTGETKAVTLNRLRGIPVADEKQIFTNAIYKITQINVIDNTIECVFFKDDPDRGTIIEWSADPLLILEWSDAESRIILEGTP